MSTQKKVSQVLPKAVSAQDLAINISKKEVKSASFAIWIRTLLQNWRQGTLGVKGRADVNKTNKKPWKQKGTGRARAGSARSPLWRGGGITFGPQPRTRTLKTSTQQKRSILNSLFWMYTENNRVCVLDWEVSGDAPKTAQAALALKNAGLAGKKVALFVSMHDVLNYASFSNIPDVTLVLFDTVQGYTLSHCDYWVMLKKDVDLFKDMVATWE